jgi:hypothetical protein
MGTGNNQPIFAGSQLILRQVFGAASFWWGLLNLYNGLFCCSQKVASGIKGDGSSRASFILEGQSKPVDTMKHL